MLPATLSPVAKWRQHLSDVYIRLNQNERKEHILPHRFISNVSTKASKSHVREIMRWVGFSVNTWGSFLELSNLTYLLAAVTFVFLDIAFLGVETLLFFVGLVSFLCAGLRCVKYFLCFATFFVEVFVVTADLVTTLLHLFLDFFKKFAFLEFAVGNLWIFLVFCCLFSPSLNEPLAPIPFVCFKRPFCTPLFNAIFKYLLANAPCLILYFAQIYFRMACLDEPCLLLRLDIAIWIISTYFGCADCFFRLDTVCFLARFAFVALLAIIRESWFLYLRNRKYSRLSLSRRDSLKHFEIFVPRHIRFLELRKIINRTTTFNKMNM